MLHFTSVNELANSKIFRIIDLRVWQKKEQQMRRYNSISIPFSCPLKWDLVAKERKVLEEAHTGNNQDNIKVVEIISFQPYFTM